MASVLTGRLFFYLTLFSILFFALPAFAATTPCPYTWTRTLSVGSTGTDVQKLQQFLNADPATTIAESGVGSSGQESSSFGALTKNAVIRFQDKYAANILTPNGLSTGTGLVGAATRAKLNAMCMAVTPVATQPVPTSTATSNSLTVSSADQPQAELAPAGALYVPFTSFTLTAGSQDLTVNSVTVERVGPAQSQAFVDVDLFESDGTFIGTAYLNSDNTATFKDPFTVPAGTSITLTVDGDMQPDLTDFDGQVATIQIDSIDASAPVTGMLPIRGTSQALNESLTIGTVTATLSPFDPNGARTRYIDQTGITFSGITLTAGTQEDVALNSINWKQDGTADNADIANVVTVVNGVSYPAVANGRYFSSMFPGAGIIVPKGDSLDVYVKGDLTGTGSDRTVEFDIGQPTDVALTGEVYGYGIYLVPGGNTDTSGNSVFLTSDGTPQGGPLTPFFAGSVVTVSPGAATSISN